MLKRHSDNRLDTLHFAGFVAAVAVILAAAIIFDLPLPH
jgi:hypothetical protein